MTIALCPSLLRYHFALPAKQGCAVKDVSNGKSGSSLRSGDSCSYCFLTVVCFMVNSTQFWQSWVSRPLSILVLPVVCVCVWVGGWVGGCNFVTIDQHVLVFNWKLFMICLLCLFLFCFVFAFIVNVFAAWEYICTGCRVVVASIQQLIKGTNSTSPCTRPRVLLLAFLETNSCPTLYPTLFFWKQLRVYVPRLLETKPTNEICLCWLCVVHHWYHVHLRMW